MANKFKGKDRDMLKRGVTLLSAIIARDATAQKTKKTAAISTRDLMLDANPPGSGPYYTAAQLLLTRFNNLRAMTV
jgi:hypothetical protein